MTVFAELRRDDELTLTTDGHYTVDDFCAALREGVTLGRPSRLHIDMRNSDQDHPSEELERMASCIAEFFTRIDVVVSDLLRFGLARAMAGFAQGLGADMDVRFDEL